MSKEEKRRRVDSKLILVKLAGDLHHMPTPTVPPTIRIAPLSSNGKTCLRDWGMQTVDTLLMAQRHQGRIVHKVQLSGAAATRRILALQR